MEKDIKNEDLVRSLMEIIVLRDEQLIALRSEIEKRVLLIEQFGVGVVESNKRVELLTSKLNLLLSKSKDSEGTKRTLKLSVEDL